MPERVLPASPSLFSRLKGTALGRWMISVYRNGGFKARVTLRSFNLPVHTVEPHAYLPASKDQPPRQPVIPDLELPDACENGPMPPPDAEAFAAFLRRFNPKRILEFGTNWGFSTVLCLLNTDAKIWTLDISAELMGLPIAESGEGHMVLPQAKVGWAYRNVPGHDGRVTQIFRDSLLLDWSETDNYPETFDLILVDACHLYDYVKSDTEKALARLAPGGVLVWHDFAHDTVFFPGVYRFVSEFARQHPNVIHMRGTQLALWQKPAHS